jgi:thousand and one amino acid protein kinase
MKKQHQTELANQQEYTSRAQRELKHKHALEAKQLPKNLKTKEQEIRRQFQDTVKVQQKQHKAHRDHLIAKLPKAEQKETLKKLKEEQLRRLAMLAEQYEGSIAEMAERQNLRLDAAQEADESDLKQRLKQEEELLVAYQSKIRTQTETQFLRERKELEQRVALRLALLDQKMTEEMSTFRAEETQRAYELKQRQKADLQDFDLQTATMGLDLQKIMDATYGNCQDDDTDSIRGSMLSLTQSSSRNSFIPFTSSSSSNTAL